jgi:hypothetical protein
MRSHSVVVAITLSLASFSTTLASTATIDFDAMVGASCTGNPVPPLFNRPGYAPLTATYVVPPAGCGKGTWGADNGNDSLLQTAPALAVSPPNSNELRWSWVNPADSNAWLRLITSPVSGVNPERQSPIVYLAAPGSISMDIAVYGVDASLNDNPAGAIEVGLAVRETGQSLPLGAKGSMIGSVEFLGVTGTGGGGAVPDSNTPVGGVSLVSSANWYHLEWVIVDSTHVDVYVNDPGHTNPIHKSVIAFPGSGNGVLLAGNNRGTLDGLAIRKPVADTVTKQWFVDVDNIVIKAPGITDPVEVVGPISSMNNRITVTRIDPTATRVSLYRNGVAYAFATAPPADFSSGMYIFTGLVPPNAGDVITATQVVGGVESIPSRGITATSYLLLDDFSNGVTWVPSPANGQQYGQWHEVSANCYGNVSLGTLDNSPCLKYTDTGYINGYYRIFDSVFPSTRSDYVLSAKIQIVPGTDPMAIRSYEMGAVVNGVGRDVTSACTPGSNTYACHNQALLAVDTTLPGNAIGRFNPGLGIYGGTQTVVTGTFAANAGDNLLAVFSTNVHDKWADIALDTAGALDGGDPCEASPHGRTPVRNAQGTWNIDPNRVNTSNGWAGAYIQVDDIRVDSIGCTPIPTVAVAMIWCASDTTVTVNGVSPTASSVQVYAGRSELIGMATGPSSTITLTRPLLAGERISATQTIGGVEGCRVFAPEVTVENCSAVPMPSFVDPLVAGATTITVGGIYSGANLIEIVDGATPIASVSSGLVPGSNIVPVPPLIKGHRICVRQRVGCTWSCSSSAPCRTVGSGHNSSVRLSLGVREVTGLTGPVGADGYSDSGPMEWVIPIDPVDAASGQKAGGAPMGHKVIPGPDWQTVTFDPTQLGTTANVVSYNLGDGVLNNTWVTLEHLAITMDQDAKDVGPYRLYVDNVKNGTQLVQDFNTTTSGVMFKNPSTAGSTSIFMLPTPNVATTDSGVFDGTAGRSDRIEWAWDAEGDATTYRWLRLTTDNLPFSPYPGGSPQIRTDAPITMRVFLPCPGPAIIVQPMSQTVTDGGCITFTVTATGAGPFMYQWYKGSMPLVDGGSVSGATTASLTICPTASVDSGDYHVVISDSCGSVTSENLMLIVEPQVQITAWRSLKTHSGAGEFAITLNAAATATGSTGGGINVESRNSATQNGITKIQVDFNTPVSVVDPTKVTATGAQTTGCTSTGANCVISAVNSYTPSSVTMTSAQTMTITFASGALPGDGCYIITIGQGTTDATITGDSDCKVRMLQSDSSGDGIVNLLDAAQTKSRNTRPVTADNCKSDQNLTMGINLIDAAQAKSRMGRRALCP